MENEVERDTEQRIECRNVNAQPVYIQRYERVSEVVKQYAQQKLVTKVVDFGCSELKFAKYLKPIAELTELSCVDVDHSLLKAYCHRVAPVAFDFTYENRRSIPLTIKVYEGSVVDSDSRLTCYDAVTCIELIEHLNDDVLRRLPDQIFGHVKPKLAIFTTPNADFNVLFELHGFRHWDHKFEWTRKEFQCWCQDIIRKYPHYSFTTTGIGNPPDGSEHLGCCSQMAVFICDDLDSGSSEAKPEQNHAYNLIADYTYPGKDVSIEESLLTSLQFKIREIGRSLLQETDDDTVKISLNWLCSMPSILKKCSDGDQIRTLLENNNIKVDDEDLVVYEREYESSDDTYGSFDECSEDTQESFLCNEEAWEEAES